ncbi:type II secretion system protein GspH [Polaromonas sp. SP1]|nr:prepilin-type N-terminal cleavage/methylation domain-containing protein [Polaromonas sp. SP1]AYQ30657.1 type II secretion system protein GspH [Polaromonas sp. SP1]QGJ20791.1 type II secretion system protein GspH [Polaromonas sp. Pch-P]
MLNACVLRRKSRRSRRSSNIGLTLLELLVVVTIIAMTTAGVSLALRDSSEAALEREAQRLAALFESARAQSRARGVTVHWHTTAEGFRFEGLDDQALPSSWLNDETQVLGVNRLQLVPEPIIGPQVIELSIANRSAGTSSPQPVRVLRVGTDGLRPFAVQAAGQP